MNVFDMYRGKISYMVLPPDDVLKIVSRSDFVIAFAFGDSVLNYLNYTYMSFNPYSIEKMRMIMMKLFSTAKEMNMIVDDSYIMQSSETTPAGKGSSLKSTLSMIRPMVKSTNTSLIFVSETVDFTVLRHVERVNRK